ncbi:dTDP-4-dehydrorhamnose reductase [Kingella potus]|uniref:dTDP-4-dehydrorhamnose reductase n=1 Tax=Kingella potus TaxID=265175 RepID=A0A377R0X6_9NEIS|nr:dTDP-4-dehydrorhamnose reductase [Kingella potus]STR00749.1 dTDP-4-dehydrorhamnose reductase [Kingella potus]
MRILLTGAKGQLGRAVRHRLPDDWELIATDSKTLDITDREAVANMLENFQPDAVVNTAAFAGTAAAAEQASRLFAVNAEGARNLAQAAFAVGAKFVHLSTDYVFDGKSRLPYAETDPPNPQCVYGQSKLAGELLALASEPDTVVVRTSWIYSAHDGNFVTALLEKAAQGGAIRLAADNAGCPTYAPDLAGTLIGLLGLPRFPQGLLHYCGGQAFSEYAFAQAVLQLEAERNPAFKMPELIPVSSAELHKHRNAPLYSVLNCTKARSLGFTPGNWQKNVAEALAQRQTA